MEFHRLLVPLFSNFLFVKYGKLFFSDHVSPLSSTFLLLWLPRKWNQRSSAGIGGPSGERVGKMKRKSGLGAWDALHWTL